MKIIFFIMIILSSGVIFAEEYNSEGYRFFARTIDEKSLFIEFTYINKSVNSQCILASDLEINLLGDFFTVNDVSMSPVRYVGPRGSLSSYHPRKFIVLAPGMKTISSIYLDKFYKVKKLKTMTLSYRVPVISCADILERHIQMPSPEFLKGASVSLTSEEKAKLKHNYPDWNEYGFVATLEPLTIRR